MGFGGVYPGRRSGRKRMMISGGSGSMMIMLKVMVGTMLVRVTMAVERDLMIMEGEGYLNHFKSTCM